MVTLEDARGLLEEGTGLLAHSIRDASVDDELIALMLARNVCLTPTLTREVSMFVHAERPDFFDDPFFLDLDPGTIRSCQSRKTLQKFPLSGEVAEWPNVPDSKSGVPQGTGGSNPSLSAFDKAQAQAKREEGGDENPRSGFDGAQRRRAPQAGRSPERQRVNPSLSAFDRVKTALLFRPRFPMMT